MILIKFCKDWADEFDVYGFRLVTVEEYDRIVECINGEEGQTGFHYSFGTNEGWYGEEPWAEVWHDSFHATAIPTDDAKIIIDNFGKSFGNFPNFDF